MNSLVFQGLDLSSYFLAVAQHKDKQEEKSTGRRREKPIRWLHANGMETGLPGASYCVVSIAFVVRPHSHCIFRNRCELCSKCELG